MITDGINTGQLQELIQLVDLRNKRALPAVHSRGEPWSIPPKNYGFILDRPALFEILTYRPVYSLLIRWDQVSVG